MIDIRAYGPADHDAVIALSLRSWTPVFASMKAALGTELATLLHGEDWREHQAQAVSATLTDPAKRAWVTGSDGQITGFVVAATADAERRIGEIVMLAVDPAWHRGGLGRALTEYASAWLRDRGMRVAMIATGGDAAHAPARRIYEQVGYTLMPAARYFKVL